MTQLSLYYLSFFKIVLQFFDVTIFNVSKTFINSMFQLM